MSLWKRLAVLGAAAEAARRYAKQNPDKAGKYVDQAAEFVDKQTKGKYRSQIDGVAQKTKGAAGLPSTPGPGATGNGRTQAYDQNPGFGKSADYTAPTPPPTPPSAPQPGQASPETPER